ncbi:MAG TPA: DUF6438 domain-containing protein [Bacteroidia bacterium]|jgi:hypothetical protein
MKTLLFSFLLLLAPCNKDKQITSSADADIDSVVIIFQTTACFGKCPIYTLTINGESKTATFIGEKNTEKIGTYTKVVSKKELADFVEAFEKAGFNSLLDEYPGMITDFPFHYITYTYKGKTKKVKERSGAPEALLTLEKTLSDYANSEGWKKTADSTNSND